MKTWDLTLQSLCKTFEGHFKVGAILSHNDFDDAELIAMYKHHYNAVTAENAMKPEYISKAPGVYYFDYADMIVDFAEKNDMMMVGHTLVWHAQSAKWLNRNEDDTVLTRAEAKTNLEAFIKEYAGRYSGRIHSWDVINEAFTDKNDEPYTGNWRDYLRRDTPNPKAVGHWYLAYENGADASKGESGADYVFDAFYFARKYDPKAILYFNEYNEEFNHKCVAITDMVNDINEQWRKHPEYDNRLLVEGIGMQSHHNHKDTKPEKIRAAFERFSKTGAVISITEMDLTFGSAENPAVPMSPEDAQTQKELYIELFKIYIEYSKYIERITFWGLNDRDSWRAWGSPLFFDIEDRAKDVFYEVIKLA
ncbi:MAG: endo-1,4-beta-xylanase [Clostridiales bacterium]|jgi:GH35 family endo-1,4-beta-xylanase|nr:endo-1,4-beta-xylanase [Clostridiales bacterium]